MHPGFQRPVTALDGIGRALDTEAPSLTSEMLTARIPIRIYHRKKVVSIKRRAAGHNRGLSGPVGNRITSGSSIGTKARLNALGRSTPFGEAVLGFIRKISYIPLFVNLGIHIL